MLIEINNKTKSKINTALVKKVINLFFTGRNEEKISIAFIGDKEMRRINKLYRGKDSYTDILSFREDNNSVFAGEIVIDFEQIKRQAKKNEHSVNYELAFILTHGLLHLSGLNDESDRGARRMEILGEAFVDKKLKIKKGKYSK